MPHQSTNPDLRTEVARLTRDLGADPLAPSGEFESAFSNVEQRVARKEQRAELSLIGTSSGAPLISYEETQKGPDAGARIHQLLADLKNESGTGLPGSVGNEAAGTAGSTDTAPQ